MEGGGTRSPSQHHPGGQRWPCAAGKTTKHPMPSSPGADTSSKGGPYRRAHGLRVWGVSVPWEAESHWTLPWSGLGAE